MENLTISNFNQNAVISGTTEFGTQISGKKFGHLAFSIDANNPTDSFNFISKNHFSETKTDSNLLTIKSDGKVGINNSSPEYDLDICGKLRIKPKNNKSTIKFLDLDSSVKGSLTYKDNYLSFTNQSSEEVLNIFCDNSKKIGINTNTPTSSLDINSNSIRLRQSSDVPDSNTVGERGEIIWSEDAIYLCLGFNGTHYKWKKSVLADV